MPSDSRSNPNASRPLMPTLASNRTAKTPITPRLAVSPGGNATPKPVRAAKPEPPGLARAGSTGAVRDVDTPVKQLLAGNITPRSSARKSRMGLDSGQTTPNGTPPPTATSRSTPTFDGVPSLLDSPGYASLGLNGGKRPVSTSGNMPGYYPPPTVRTSSGNGHARSGSNASTGGTRESSPMFFHASDARSSVQETKSQSKKSPTFFYANGEEDKPIAKALDLPSPPLSAVGRPQQKFFFASGNGRDELGLSPPLSTPPLRTLSPENLLPANTVQPAPRDRSPSPTKDSIHLSYRKGASQIIRPASHRPATVTGLPEHPPSSVETVMRRTSITRTHTKSPSTSSIDSTRSTRKASVSKVSNLHNSPLASPGTTTPPKTWTERPSSISMPAPTPLHGVQFVDPPLQSPGLGIELPTSPGKAPSDGSIDPHAEARRERKVLDLEISNQSLLAINRGLEREVRKQKTELRRFRRLSRAGRFSTLEAPIGRDSSLGDDLDTAHVSDGEEISQIDLDGQPELISSEDDFDDDDDDEAGGDSTDSLASSTLSPAALADRDARHRAKDEKRLQLDLSKHRELLMDSQRMNQALKRCMSITEALIADGRKALEYQVRVSDVKLGGRILEHEDIGIAADESSQGLLSPWSGSRHTSLTPGLGEVVEESLEDVFDEAFESTHQQHDDDHNEVHDASLIGVAL